MEWFVLWLWLAFPSQWNGIPVTAGWVSHQVFHSKADCDEAVARMGPAAPWPVLGLTCLPVGEEPQGKIAEITHEQ